MNRTINRTKSLGSSNNVGLYNPKAKRASGSYVGRLVRLPNLALLVGLLIVAAFFMAQSVAPQLPSVDRLEGIDGPRNPRVGVQQAHRQGEVRLGRRGAIEEQPCRGEMCGLRRGGDADGGAEQERGGALTTAEAAASSIEHDVATIHQLLEQREAAGRRQQQQQVEGGIALDGQQQQEVRGGGSGDVQLGSHAQQQQRELGGTLALQQGQQQQSGGGVRVVQRRKHRKRSKYTASLKQDVEDLILEAAEVAKLHGIATEADAAEENELGGQEEEGAAEVAEQGVDALLKAAGACSPSSCAPHGACVEGRCQCVAMYTGKRCGHAVFLSRPFLPEVMKAFSAGFEGELLLHRATPHTELKVYHPPKPGATGAKAYSVVADEALLQQLRPLLPPRDTALKGFAFESCAVVGSSGSLLIGEQGPAIDAHAAVFRFNTAPTAGYERYVGTRTTHRITNLRSWGFHEGGEAVLVHTTLPQAVEGLLWNARQPSPWSVWSFDPDFEEYMTRSFSFAPSQGLFGVMAALHSCRSVTLYGFGLSMSQGVLQRYYDPCQTLSNPARVEQQWAAIAALVQAGLLRLGEPCTLECMGPGSGAACARCRDAVGVRLPQMRACDAAAQATRVAQQYSVPWLQGGSGSAAAGEAGTQAA